ncbi:hypothetical protein GGX14DRAFT_699870 [Mycena pura]|uniref:Uncharacterized protein n=1 Tax=Mycena pura TaxID=153505 RepID=A0AAD6V2S5_9AGAR|nr:hypothetical protein GGX14DRAFT_699870 [Mycena pura]
MAPGTRKQTTYAHKRKRPKRTHPISVSSPLNQPGEDDYLSNAELSRRLLKRARRSSNPEMPSSKRLKSKPTPAGSPSQFETPHPSALTEEQKFKLNSSRGLPVHPDQFSPLPASRRASRTASRNLKENAPSRSSNKSKFLDSPFNSRPGSAVSSPQPAQLARSSLSKPDEPCLKRTLSDTNYNPNIPQSASTTNSPTRAHSPVRFRRPSAPSPQRPGDWIPKDQTLTSFDLNIHSAIGNPFFFPTNGIDFNRPPSSLSFYGDDSHFFDDAQGISTPAGKQGAYMLGSAATADDERLDEPDLTLTEDAMDVDVTLSSGLKARPTRERSPWLSDSLISPPPSQEWNRTPQEGAYIHRPSANVDMNDDLSLGLGLEPEFAFAPEKDSDHAADDNRAVGGRGLKQMFDDLALGPNNRPLNIRTRSLDSAAEPAPADSDTARSKPKGRDRRGTIRASDFVKAGAAPAPARRTRSGTVVGPVAPPQRARSLNAAAAAAIAEIGEADEREELGGWCAEGWAVAAPPSPVVTRRRPGAKQSAARVAFPESVDELDLLSGGTGLMPSPVLLTKRGGGGKGKVKQVVVEEDESDDELLLKPGFNVWE